MNEPKIVIKKAERVLELYDGDEPIQKFTIALGFSPVGDKSIAGDGKTPEGEFFVFVKNRASKYHRSFGLSYPHRAAAERGLANGTIALEQYDEMVTRLDNGLGPPQHTALGGEIYVHGGGTAGDWTEGCIALDDVSAEEIFEQISVGSKVFITP